MKKFVYSLVILGGFGLYALFQNESDSQRSVLSDPSASLSMVATPTPNPKSSYTAGRYTGSVTDAYYGNIQVQVTISGGKITNVAFLQYPNDRPTSRSINTEAMPNLKQEAIQAQSANVDIVSGATDSSQAFRQSLSSALAQAKS